LFAYSILCLHQEKWGGWGTLILGSGRGLRIGAPRYPQRKTKARDSSVTLKLEDGKEVKRKKGFQFYLWVCFVRREPGFRRSRGKDRNYLLGEDSSACATHLEI